MAPVRAPPVEFNIGAQRGRRSNVAAAGRSVERAGANWPRKCGIFYTPTGNTTPVVVVPRPTTMSDRTDTVDTGPQSDCDHVLVGGHV